MKIAISGAHKAGKTTLIENLQEALSEYTCNIESYFTLEEEGYVFSETPTLQDYTVMLEHSIEQVYTAGDKTILDRSPLDFLAYIEAVKDYGFDISLLYNKVQNAMNEIDLVVFVPIEKPDLISCPDSEEPKLRRRVNEILNNWIWDFSANVIEVKGPPDERKNQVLQKISEG